MDIYEELKRSRERVSFLQQYCYSLALSVYKDYDLSYEQWRQKWQKEASDFASYEKQLDEFMKIFSKRERSLTTIVDNHIEAFFGVIQAHLQGIKKLKSEVFLKELMHAGNNLDILDRVLVMLEESFKP